MQQNSLLFFQPSDAFTQAQRMPVQGDLTLGNITSYFMPISRNVLPYEDSPRLGIRDYNVDFPQILKDAYSGINKFGQAFRGELSPQEIQQLAFDTSLNVAGGGLVGSKIIPNAVPDGSLGIFAGSSARYFPAKKLINEVDETPIVKAETRLKEVQNELSKGRLALGDQKTDALRAEQDKLIEQADSARFKALQDRKNYLVELDRFMESQDYRKGIPNQDARFFGSQRKFGTGLFQMPDGKYRFEIDDTKASLRELPRPTSYSDAIELTKDNFANLQGMDILRKALPNRPLESILKHDELFKNYPQLKNTKVAFVDDYPYLGGYYPNENFIIVNSGSISKNFADESVKDRVMSTLLHEIQHNVQEIENFSRGGSRSGLENVRLNIQDASRKKDLSYQGNLNYINANKENIKVNHAIRLLDLKKKSMEGSQPRFLFGQQDWYKYGDQIRREVTEELGYPYPRTKSPKRDEWQKRAYRKLYNINEYQVFGANDFLDRSPQDLKNYSKRLERVMDKNLKDKLNYDSQSKRTEALFKMVASGETNTLAYLNKLGEVEARIVQARSGFDPDFKDEMYRPRNPYQNLPQGLFEFSSPSRRRGLFKDDATIDMYERGQGLLTID